MQRRWLDPLAGELRRVAESIVTVRPIQGHGADVLIQRRTSTTLTCLYALAEFRAVTMNCGAAKFSCGLCEAMRVAEAPPRASTPVGRSWRRARPSRTRLPAQCANDAGQRSDCRAFSVLEAAQRAHADACPFGKRFLSQVFESRSVLSFSPKPASSSSGVRLADTIKFDGSLTDLFLPIGAEIAR